MRKESVMVNHSLFLQSIQDKIVLNIVYDSKEKGRITRKCAPLDYGPSQRKGKLYGTEKYHVFDLNSPDQPHPIAMEPDRIVSMSRSTETFNPKSFINWEVHWLVPRNW